MSQDDFHIWAPAGDNPMLHHNKCINKNFKHFLVTWLSTDLSQANHRSALPVCWARWREVWLAHKSHSRHTTSSFFSEMEMQFPGLAHRNVKLWNIVIKSITALTQSQVYISVLLDWTWRIYGYHNLAKGKKESNRWVSSNSHYEKNIKCVKCSSSACVFCSTPLCLTTGYHDEWYFLLNLFIH